MKKKQQHNPLIDKDSKEFVAPNRKTFRTMSNDVYQPKRLKQTPAVNVKKAEWKAFRKEIARKHGSQTGELKKKHLRRQIELELREDFRDIEEQKYEYFHGGK